MTNACIYEVSMWTEAMHCYKSSLSYLTQRLGLVGFQMQWGGLDNGFSLCTVPSFGCSPGISNTGKLIYELRKHT